MKRSKNRNLARRARPILIFLAVAMLLPLLFTATVPEPAAAWITDTTWTRSRRITVNNSIDNSQQLDNYAIRIIVLYDTDMRSDYYDLRFYSKDNSTLYPHWVERRSADNAIAWVRVPSIAANTWDNLYMYYGKADAVNVENFSAVFHGLVGFWAFEEGSGACRDYTPPDYDNGTATTPVYIDNGRYGKAIDVQNQAANVFSVPSSASLQIADYITVEAWVWHDVAGVLDAFVSKRTDETAFTLGVGSTNVVDARIGKTTMSGTAGITTISTGQWYHIAMTYNNVDLKIYVNGALDKTWNYPNQLGSNTAALIIGDYTPTGTYFWDGAIDELRIWNTAKTDAEIQDFASPRPITIVGPEEILPIAYIIITNIACDNTLVDRDDDITEGNTVTGTKLQADVEYALPNNVVKENVKFAIFDRLGAKINNKAATDYTQLTDNKRRFSVNYLALDNTLSDSQLGWWDIEVYASDNAGNSGYNILSDVFCVDDLTSTRNVENLIKHRIRTYGTISRVSGITPTGLENVWIYDNNWASPLIPSLIGNNWENTRVPPSKGTFYLTLVAGVLDGKTPENADNYAFPNFTPTIVSTNVSEALIDRKLDYGGSGAKLTTTITVRISDPDNRDDLNVARIGVRDALDALVENIDVWASRTVIDENTYEVTQVFNSPDNWPNSGLGLHDIWRFILDAYGASASGWDLNKFTVDDLTSTINYNLTSPYFGWPFTISGTVSRVSGTASADNVWLVDGKHGTWALGAGNAWTKTFTITLAQPNENVAVTLRMVDSPLDGQILSSYLVNPDMKYQVEVRRENNYALMAEVPIENRPLTVKFRWEGGVQTKVLATNPENIIVLSGGKIPYLVDLDDNGKYWRRRIPIVGGGVLVFAVPQENVTYNQYTFTIQDYTGKFRSPSGWVSIRKYVDNYLVSVNDDWWDATDSAYSYLILHELYQVYLFGEAGAQRHLGHFQAEADFTPSPFVVGALAFGENKIFKWAIIEMEAVRDNSGSVVIKFRDAHDNTDNITLMIYTLTNDLQYTADFAYPYELEATWVGADNDSSYRILLEVNNREFGSWSEWLTVGPLISQLPFGPPPGIGGIIGTVMPLAGLAGLFIVGVIAMSFGAQYASTAMLAVALTALFLKFLSIKMGANLMPLPGGAIILLLVLAAAWKIGEEV